MHTYLDHGRMYGCPENWIFSIIIGTVCRLLYGIQDDYGNFVEVSAPWEK